MIIGGTGGASKTGGGSRTGYRETFIHGIVRGSNAFINSVVPVFSCLVRVKNTSGAWVTITDAEQFGITASESGAISCTITIENLEKWSNIGAENLGLLSPSNRILQIISTTTISGTPQTSLLFNGIITTYAETIGQSNGSISLNCRGLSTSLVADGTKTADTNGLTRWRVLEQECKANNIDGPFIAFSAIDSELGGEITYSKISDLVTRLYGSAYRTDPFLYGISVLPTAANINADSAFAVTDNEIISYTRSTGASDYNTIRTMAQTDEGWIYDEVSNAADVAARGKIYEPKRWWIPGETTLTAINELATNVLAQMILGQITAQIRFNPEIQHNLLVDFSTVRGSVSGKAKIVSYSHQYSDGNAQTNIKLAIIEVD